MKRLVILLCLLFNACSLYALDTFWGYRLPAELAHSNMSAHDAVEYGTPGSNFGVGQLVLVPLPYCNGGRYRFGIIRNQLMFRSRIAKHYLVDNFDDPMSDMVPENKILALYDFWQCIFQPMVPLSVLDESICGCKDEMDDHGKCHIQIWTPPLDKKFLVLGDIHGSMRAITKCFLDWYQKGYIGRNMRLRDDLCVICLGDYADRGTEGAEVWYVITQLYLFNPDKVFLLRGNHESRWQASTNRGIVHEWEQKFGHLDDCIETRDTLMGLYRRLPHALFLGIQNLEQNIYEFVLCCHGGLPEGQEDQLKAATSQHLATMSPEVCSYEMPFRSNNGLRWNDFHANDPVLFLNGPRTPNYESDRGPGSLSMSRDVMQEYLTRLSNVDNLPRFHFFGVVRGHQHMPGMQELRNFTYGDNSWQPLVSLKQYSIDRYTVFTVNSCPEILERFFGQSLPETYCLLWLQANQWRFMPILLN